MGGIGVAQAARESGLTRETIVYLDRRGLLEVQKVNGARRFTEAQVRQFKEIANLRLMGLGLEDAVTVATRNGSGADLVRLCLIARAKAQEIDRTLQAWVWLCSLIVEQLPTAQLLPDEAMS